MQQLKELSVIGDAPVYLLVHYTETKKKIAEHISAYNETLQAEWMQSKEQFSEKHKGKTFNQVRLKSCHENTIYGILEMYGSFLLRNKRLNMFGATFKLNNASIATKFKGRMSKTTAWRHVCKAIEAGVFTSKTWHGSNSSYDIEWNTDLLCAEYNEDFCGLLVDYYTKLFKTPRVPVEMYKTIMRLKPSFNQFPKGCMVSSCNDTVTRILLEHNNNMISGLGSAEYVSVYDPEQGYADKSIKKPEQDAIALSALNQHQEQSAATPSDQRSSLTRDQREQLLYYAKLAWGMAKSAIYKDRFTSDLDLKLVYRHLMAFFAHGATYQNGLSTRYNNFCERIMLAKKFQDRHPEYTFMNPATYFDPTTEKGFTATKKWYEAVKEQRKKQKDYNEHNKLLATLCRQFVDDPGAESYRQAVQTLSKKRNKALLDIFNEFVVKSEEIIPELFEKSRIAMMNFDKN